MSGINPILPLEIFHMIITIIGDMAVILDFSSKCFPRIHGFTYDAKSQEKRREWHRSLVSVSQVSQAFSILCQRYFKMLSIEVSVYCNVSEWSPPTFASLYLTDKSGIPSPKCLEMVVGLKYHHWDSWHHHLPRCSFLEPVDPRPSESLLLNLPSLQALHIDIPAAMGIFTPRVQDNRLKPDFSLPRKLLERYAFGRPEGEILRNRSYTPLCSNWAIPPASSASSLTHLSLSHITNLPLHHLLTSASLVALQLHCCTTLAVDSQISLFSASSGAASAASGEAITLMPCRSGSSSSTPLSQPMPGFNLRTWRVKGGQNCMSPLLRYCTLLEHLVISQTGRSTANPNTVQIFQHSLLPEKVTIPEPIPFQNVLSLRWEGNVSMTYFCFLVEAMGEDVKLFPNLREITLDDVFHDSSLIDEHGDMGCGRILSRHVHNLEELTVLRAQPDAFDLSQALAASSHSLKKLRLRWTIRDGHVDHCPVDACESTLCDGLEAIKGINCLETLEVAFNIFNVDIANMFLDSGGANGSEHTHGNRRPNCQWTRFSTILSSDPTIDFPLLRRVEMNLIFHSTDQFPASKRQDDYLPSIRSLRERLAGLLHMGMHNDGVGNTPWYHEVEVKVKVSFESENWYGEHKSHGYEVTADAITGGLMSFHGVGRHLASS